MRRETCPRQNQKPTKTRPSKRQHRHSFELYAVTCQRAEGAGRPLGAAQLQRGAGAVVAAPILAVVKARWRWGGRKGMAGEPNEQAARRWKKRAEAKGGVCPRSEGHGMQAHPPTWRDVRACLAVAESFAFAQAHVRLEVVGPTLQLHNTTHNTTHHIELTHKHRKERELPTPPALLQALHYHTAARPARSPVSPASHPPTAAVCRQGHRRRRSPRAPARLIHSRASCRIGCDTFTHARTGRAHVNSLSGWRSQSEGGQCVLRAGQGGQRTRVRVCRKRSPACGAPADPIGSERGPACSGGT